MLVDESQLPDWPVLPPFDDIASLFHTETTAFFYQYRILFLHNRGRQWHPFNGPPASDLLDLVAAHTNRLCRELQADAGLLPNVHESQCRGEGVVILTDTDTLDNPSHATLFAELDANLPSNCAVFVLPETTGFDPLAIERARRILSRIAASNGFHNWGGVRSPATLVTELVRTFEHIASGLIRSDRTEKFDDEQVRSEALASARELEMMLL